MGTGSVSLDDKSIVNESSVEEDSVWVVWCDKCGFFIVGVINGCIDTSTWGTHGSAVQLFPASVPESEDAVAHDDAHPGEDVLDWEAGWKFRGMQVEPSPDGFDAVIVVDVGVHGNGVGCVDDGIVSNGYELVKVSKELPAVLEITRAEVDYLL